MSIQTVFAILSFVIIVGFTIPYMFDIAKGRARPSRAARLMFFFLLVVALLQQHSAGSGLTIVVTIGEAISSTILLWLALRHGVGGLSRGDLFCYALLIIDVIVWKSTNNVTIALHMTILADLIAFWPTVIKTWRDPYSETPLFFWAGVVAPILSILAGQNYSYTVIVFPVYLAVANLFEVALIHRRDV